MIDLLWNVGKTCQNDFRTRPKPQADSKEFNARLGLCNRNGNNFKLIERFLGVFRSCFVQVNWMKIECLAFPMMQIFIKYTVNNEIHCLLDNHRSSSQVRSWFMRVSNAYFKRFEPKKMLLLCNKNFQCCFFSLNITSLCADFIFA